VSDIPPPESPVGTSSSRSPELVTLFLFACLLLFGGLLIGVAIEAPGAPVIGSAHTLGILEATLAFALVALWPQLHLNRVNAWLLVGIVLFSFGGNLAGVCVSVLTGAGGGMWLPPWDAYLTNADPGINRIVAVLLNMSGVALAIPVVLVLAWLDVGRSKVRQRWITWSAIAISVAMLVPVVVSAAG